MMGRKWTPAQRKKFIATMKSKKKESGGMEIPLDMIPLPAVRAVVAKKPRQNHEAEAIAAMGELIVSVWEAMQRRNAR